MIIIYNIHKAEKQLLTQAKLLFSQLYFVPIQIRVNTIGWWRNDDRYILNDVMISVCNLLTVTTKFNWLF